MVPIVQDGDNNNGGGNYHGSGPKCKNTNYSCSHSSDCCTENCDHGICHIKGYNGNNDSNNHNSNCKKAGDQCSGSSSQCCSGLQCLQNGEWDLCMSA